MSSCDWVAVVYWWLWLETCARGGEEEESKPTWKGGPLSSANTFPSGTHVPPAPNRGGVTTTPSCDGSARHLRDACDRRARAPPGRIYARRRRRGEPQEATQGCTASQSTVRLLSSASRPYRRHLSRTCAHEACGDIVAGKRTTGASPVRSSKSSQTLATSWPDARCGPRRARTACKGARSCCRRILRNGRSQTGMLRRSLRSHGGTGIGSRIGCKSTSMSWSNGGTCSDHFDCCFTGSGSATLTVTRRRDSRVYQRVCTSTSGHCSSQRSVR